MANNMANVWAQMGYVPPRGQCNYKQSLMSPRCPCLRFMLHPLKSSSSYECDGCNHHASFHSMENKAEDEIRKKWEQEAKDRVQREEEEAQRPKKRPRAIGYRNDIAPAQTAKEKHALTVEDQETQDRFDTMVHGIEHDIEQWGGQYRTEAAAKAALGDKYGVRPKSKRRAAATRAASRITELDGQDDVIEL